MANKGAIIPTCLVEGRERVAGRWLEVRKRLAVQVVMSAEQEAV